MTIERLEPAFVDFIPSDLEPGTLYVSLTYRTTIHLCASGCGNKVVLPLSPAEWQFTFDGQSISMSPSVGNWEYPCKAHYWIRKGRVEWAGPWSHERIEAGRARDELELDAYFVERAPDESQTRPAPIPFWSRLFNRRK